MANSYGFDPAAWSVDGATHRGELLRVLAYAATMGSEGIVSPGDCKVSQLGTAGPQIQISPGGLIIRNRSAGVRNQTYVANGRTTTTLDVTPTGGSARQDLVVVRIEDPQYAPWPTPAPADAPNYQYARPFIIENVPSGTFDASKLNLGYSAYALARLELPAGTTNVTQAMIKETRKLAQPHSETVYDVQAELQVNGSADQITTSDTSYGFWPQNTFAVEIPRWATHAQVSIKMGIAVNGPGDVDTRVRLGNLVGPVVPFDYNGNAGTPAGFVEVLQHEAYAEFDVRALQGTVQTIRTESKRTFTNNTGGIWADSTLQIIFDVRFAERTV